VQAWVRVSTCVAYITGSSSSSSSSHTRRRRPTPKRYYNCRDCQYDTHSLTHSLTRGDWAALCGGGEHVTRLTTPPPPPPLLLLLLPHHCSIFYFLPRSTSRSRLSGR